MNQEQRIEREGEKRNMSTLEKKVDALLLFCTAESEEARRHYHVGLRQLMGISNSAGSLRENPDTEIDQALADLGIPDHLRGYEYLQTAIRLAVNDPETVHYVTGLLYPAVARFHGTQSRLVERSIRNAIECGWTRCDLDKQEQYFGGKIDPNRCKPTNAEFIARVANIIRRQR